MIDKRNEFEFLSNLDVYKSATIPERTEMILDLTHHSLESGTDAHIELFKKLIPELLYLARLGLWASKCAIPTLIECEVFLALNKDCACEPGNAYEPEFICGICGLKNKTEDTLAKLPGKKGE